MSPTEASALLANPRLLAPTRMMSRLLTILFILLCFEMGVLLFVFPWVPFWNKNYFVSTYPWVAAIARNYFLRGAISGIGLADIWLGFFEAWRLRRSAPVRGPNGAPDRREARGTKR